MRKKTMEERIQMLEDIHEIKVLRNSYSYNSNVDGEAGSRQFADNFVADGEFNVGLGSFSGPDNIYEALKSMPNFFTCFMHISTNGTIEVDGDTATGKWTGLFPHIIAGDTKLQWGNCYYYDEYVRTSEGWRFKKVYGKGFFFTKPWCDMFPTFIENSENCIVAS